MRSSSKVCLDASLIVRMHAPESLEHSRVIDLRERWLGAHVTFLAPALLRYEVTNAVLSPVRLGLADAEVALSVIRSLERIPIHYFDSIDLNISAFEIARSLGLSASYDAHYLALARQEGAELYTADRRLVTAARSKFPFVHYVMDE